jgi:hypothetical protein
MSFPNYKTVHRRFQHWCRNEVLRNVLTSFANTLREQGEIDERESFSMPPLPLPKAAVQT